MNDLLKSFFDKVLTAIGSVLLVLLTVYLTNNHDNSKSLTQTLENKVNKEDFNKKCDELKVEIDKKAPLDFVKTINDKLDKIILIQLEKNINNPVRSSKVDSVHFPLKKRSDIDNQFASKNNKLGT